MTLATKVFRVRYSFSTTPRKMVFISGMPEPAQVMSRESHLMWPFQDFSSLPSPSLPLYQQPEEPGSV